MDYKTNILLKELEVKENLLVEIDGLNFGIMGEDKVVFDYTAYFEENNLTPIDYKTFLRYNKHYIETIASYNELKTSEMVYQNTDGHILITSELVFLFLAFANKELLIYFNALLSEVIQHGIAHSNGFIFTMASQRLSTNLLQDIIKERENGTTGSE